MGARAPLKVGVRVRKVPSAGLGGEGVGDPRRGCMGDQTDFLNAGLTPGPYSRQKRKKGHQIEKRGVGPSATV